MVFSDGFVLDLLLGVGWVCFVVVFCVVWWWWSVWSSLRRNPQVQAGVKCTQNYYVHVLLFGFARRTQRKSRKSMLVIKGTQVQVLSQKKRKQ
jgi:hypothetical protein